MVTDFGISRAQGDPGATPRANSTSRNPVVHGTGAVRRRSFPGRFARRRLRDRGDLVQPLDGSSAVSGGDAQGDARPGPKQRARAAEDVGPSLSRDLETIVLKCLNKEPQRRYASAGALSDDLQRYLEGFPIQARPVSTWEHGRRWCRRRPGVAVLLAVLVLTVTSSLGGLFLLWRRSETALARAVSSDQAASVALHALVGLLTESADDLPLVMSERIEKASRVVRDLMVKLRRDQGLSSPNVVAIGNLARGLSWDLRRQGNTAESRALLTETLTFLGEMKNQTDDPQVDISLAKTLRELGCVAQSEANFDEALSLCRRAEKILIGLVRDRRDLDAITLIDSLRQTIARSLDRGGQVEARRRLLESHIQMLERLNHDPDADPRLDCSPN